MTSETVHNPDQFMADFRHILSQGRKRIGVLVGAGAPVAIRVNEADGTLMEGGAALIPAVAGLTDFVIESLQGPTLTAMQAIRHELGGSANIEIMLSRVRLLATALGSTTSTVNGLTGTGYRELGELVCNLIGQRVQVALPVGRSAYTEFISWIGGTVRLRPLEIFTTNYDLLFEEAFERARIPYFDGFSGGNAPFFDPVTVASDDLPARWARLWKLHGSLGWSIENGNVVRGRGKQATQLIYPDHLKYDLVQKQPYAALFERLKQFLSQPDTLLLTIGFSFGDAHISAVLDEGLAMNPGAAVFAFQYQALEKEALACKIAYDRPNMSVYAEDGAVIRSVLGKWRPGQLPNDQWEEIRKTFWACRNGADKPVFTLGDFKEMARFCALAQATDLRQANKEPESPLTAEGTLPPQPANDLVNVA
jgi:hypothetical protein